MSNIAWKTDLARQDVAPRASRSHLTVLPQSQARAPLAQESGSVRPLPAGRELPGKALAGQGSGGGIASLSGSRGPAGRPVRSQAAPVARQADQNWEKALRKVLLGLIVLLSLVIVGEVVFQLGIAPNMTIKTIALDLEPGISEAEVRAALGLDGPLAYYACDPASLAEALRAIPAVADGQVELRFPDSLRIQATCRTPLLVARVNGRFDGQRLVEGEGQSGVVLDRQGVVFAPATVADASLPVLSGVDFRNFRLGIKMPRPVLDFVADLETIRLERPDVYQAFSEFRLVPQGQYTVEVLVYTMASPIPVRINNRLTVDNALYILRTMSLLAGHPVGRDVVEVDFRTRNLILRKGDK